MSIFVCSDFSSFISVFKIGASSLFSLSSAATFSSAPGSCTSSSSVTSCTNSHLTVSILLNGNARRFTPSFFDFSIISTSSYRCSLSCVLSSLNETTPALPISGIKVSTISYFSDSRSFLSIESTIRFQP